MGQSHAFQAHLLLLQARRHLQDFLQMSPVLAVMLQAACHDAAVTPECSLENEQFLSQPGCPRFRDQLSATFLRQ